MIEETKNRATISDDESLVKDNFHRIGSKGIVSVENTVDSQNTPAPTQKQQPQSHVPHSVPNLNRGKDLPEGYPRSTLPKLAAATNTIGLIGLIVALISLFAGWFPILGWLGWFTGLILSLVGLTQKPRGLAVVGLLISIISFVVIVAINYYMLLLAGVSNPSLSFLW